MPNTTAQPPATPAPNPRPPRPVSAQNWIIQYHDVWSRLTLSSFYQDLAEQSLSVSQFARWLLDRASISMAVLKAATTVSLTLTKRTGRDALPLLRVAEENTRFLVQYTTMQGLDINSQYRLSHAAKRLVDLMEASTAPDASPIVAITAVWGFMLSSWQAWALCRRRGRGLPPHFENVAQFLSREASITALVETQALLDEMLNKESTLPDFEKAGKTFEEIARRACAVLDHTLYMGEGNQVPLCVCGRKGHLPAQCTFKSHI